ncbi:MAG: amidohydrolase family protein [Caldilineaceae bacterium]
MRDSAVAERVDWILRRARLTDDAPLVDIAIDQGYIIAIDAALPAQAHAVWDLEGRVVLPGLVDAHTHLDKSHLPAPNQSGTLREAITVWQQLKKTRPRVTLQQSVRRAIQSALANGVTAMRSHIDIVEASDLQTLETILEVREEMRACLDLQLVALGPAAVQGVMFAPMTNALALGVDHIGGAPALTDEPQAQIDAAFVLAERTGKALDLHIDETEDPQMLTLAHLAQQTIAYGMQGLVTAGHCCSLAFVDEVTAGCVMDLVAEARLNITTLPSCNLVLMGRNHRPTPRGITLVKELLARGVNVCVASDNVQDPFNPFGSYDLLHMANLNAHVAHMTGAPEIRTSLAMVTNHPAQALGLTAYGMHVGAVADLVVLDTTRVLAAVTEIPPRLATFKRGQLVVRTTIERQWPARSC